MDMGCNTPHFRYVTTRMICDLVHTLEQFKILLTLDGKIYIMVAVAISVDSLTFVHAGVLTVRAAYVQLRS